MTVLLLLAHTLPGCLGTVATSSTDAWRANELEFAYTYFAADMGLAKICEKIRAESYLSAAWGGDGHQISYTRSNCYYHLALKTGDSVHCPKVVPKTHFLLDGSAMTRENCESDVAARNPLRSGGGNYDLLLTAMGFPEDQLSTTDYAQRCFRYPGMQDYHHLGLIPPEFHERVRFLPDFTSPERDPAVLLSQARVYDLAYRRKHVNDGLKGGKTSLHTAAYRGSLACVRQLLELGASLEVEDDEGASVLHDAAVGGHVEVVGLFLAKGFDSGTKNRHGQTPLHVAAASGHAEVVDLLLRSGADIGVVDDAGHTPLWWSTARGHEATSLLLLDRGADPSRSGDVVIQAVKSNDLQALKRLLDAGAGLDVTGEGGQSPLHIAAFYRATHKNSETLRFLLDQGAAVNARGPNGLTPLHQAARSGNLEAFRLLIDHGADPDLEDALGRTALDCGHQLLRTVIRERLPIADLTYLLELGVSAEDGSRPGESLYHLAVNARNVAAVAKLREHGAESNHKNRAGKTALELARIELERIDERWAGHHCETAAVGDSNCSERERRQYAELSAARDETREIIRILEIPERPRSR